MSFGAERLYELLPAVYRVRDGEAMAQSPGVLRALLEVIASAVEVLEEDLAQLYDDQFVETCASWVAPYIGDLIGYRTLYGITDKVGSPRAEVAGMTMVQVLPIISHAQASACPKFPDEAAMINSCGTLAAATRDGRHSVSWRR